MKYDRIIALTAALLIGASFVCAESMKVITLKDGSTIKGEIISFSQGQYSVRTNHLGEIKIDDEEILSISAAALEAPRTPQLKNQVQNVQGIIFNDPQLMQEIISLMEDPQVVNLLSNPNLMSDVQSMDEERIRNNPAVQQLLQNENIQRLMLEIQQKLPQQ